MSYKYIIKYGRIEVSPEIMEIVGQENLSEEDKKRIKKYRENFMQRMRLHFAKKPEV